jgi:VanZ family protein
VKALFVLAWAVMLGVFACTSDLDALLRHQTVHFRWVAEPDFTDLLIVHDMRPYEPYWLMITAGHEFGFAALTLLIYHLRRNLGSAAAAAFVYAALTEVLQLYFGRDGRLADFVIDSFGVMASIAALKAIRKMKSAGAKVRAG